MTYDADTFGNNETAAAVHAGLMAAESDEIVDGKLHAFVVPEGAKIELVDIEEKLAKHQPYPERKTGTFKVHDAASFIAYIDKHQLLETEVWSDAQGQKIIGVVNAHASTNADEEQAGWGDHRVEYDVKLTDAWQAWAALDSAFVDQVTFANHVEDRLIDIVVPEAAELLEIAQSFEANTNVSFQSANVLATGERQFMYREETDARAGRSGTLTIPKEFTISLQPFEGAALFELTARLRYKLRDGKLTLGYQLVRPKDVLRAAFVSVSDEIAAGVNAPVFLGVSG